MESNPNRKVKALYDASGDLEKLANKTVEETIKIGTKMLIKHSLLPETSIGFMQILFRKFLEAHNKATETILEIRMKNATTMTDNTDEKKMIEDPEFRDWVNDIFREALK